MIKTFSLFILLSPHRLVFVTIMCEVRFSSRKREKSLPARNVAMKLSRQRISACQVSLLASLANKLYKYHGWLLFCIGTLSKVQWLSVVLQSSAVFVLRKTLCFLLVELTSFSFLIINGFQNSDSFCLEISVIQKLQKITAQAFISPTKSCLMNFEVWLDDMHTIYLKHSNKLQYVLCLQSTSSYRFSWLKYQRFILKPKFYSGYLYFSYKLGCRGETV